MSDPGSLIAQQAAATARAMQLDADRKLAEPLIEEWRALSEQQREERRVAADAERERRDREAREAAKRFRAEVHERHRSLFARVGDPVLASVVALHFPSADGHDCLGCPDEEDADDYYGWTPDWPCRTFLLVEEALT